MLNIRIEKEIETRHTVIRGMDWDIRQTVSMLVVTLIVAFFWWIADLDATGIAIVAVPFGSLAYLVGWKQEAGLRVEGLLVKYLQKTLYKNERRSYHTRNGYVDLMNSAYTVLREKDMADKKAMKTIKKQKKREKAKKKASKFRAYE